MNVKQITALGVSALLCLSAQTVLAEDSYKATGGYFGGAVGATEYDEDGLQDIANQFGLNFDDSDAALQIFGGYRFNKYFAIEGKLASLGEYSISDCCNNIKTEASAISVDAALIIPFGTAPLDLQAQIGLAYGSNQIMSTLGINEDDTDVGGHAGLALRWHITPAVTARVGVESWAFEADDGTDVTFTATSIGAQYNF